MATTRMLRDPCLACGRAEWADTPVATACAHCHAPRTCPPTMEWPSSLKRWMIAQLVRNALEPYGGHGNPQAWPSLLAQMMRGRAVPVPHVGIHAIPWAASPDEVYAIAARLAGEMYPSTTTTTPSGDDV